MCRLSAWHSLGQIEPQAQIFPLGTAQNEELFPTVPSVKRQGVLGAERLQDPEGTLVPFACCMNSSDLSLSGSDLSRRADPVHAEPL